MWAIDRDHDELQSQVARRIELTQQHLESEDRRGALEHAYALEQLLERHGAARRKDRSLQDTYESIRETISQLEDEEHAIPAGLVAGGPAEDVVPEAPPSPALRVAVRAALVGAALALLLLGWPAIRADRENSLLQDHLSRVMLLGEVRGIDVAVSARRGPNGRVLVYDVSSVAAGISEDAMLALLIRFAREVRAERFARVELASHGITRYRLSGDYFAALGQDAAQQNLWTFPANVLNPDGSHAFSARTGPWQAAARAQGEDFHQLCHHWYGAQK